jgi:Na+/H+ ion antiporter subunit
MPRRLGFWLRWWVALFVLYVLLVFKTESAEFVAGALCAAVAATAVTLVRSRGKIHFAPGYRWLRAMPALIVAVVVETVLLTRVLWRALRGERVHGRMRCIHFPDARRKGPEAMTRRAVEKFLGSVSPNSLVVGFDERHRVVIVHQLEPTEQPPRVDWGAP